MKFNSLVKQIESVQSVLQASTANAINVALTIRNWLIGYYIVEFEQRGEDRAAYGEKLLENLEKKLDKKGMTVRRFREYRRIYSVYPEIGDEIVNFLSRDIISKLPSAVIDTSIRRTASAELKGIPAGVLISKLSYSHLLMISIIEEPSKRLFYELESIKGCWSHKELDRQISSLYYERSGLSKNKEALSALANKKAVVLKPVDIINTPITLEFLGLNDRALVTEEDLEQAILDNLQAFLLEMGHGFCFESRQKRILIDDDYFFIDLLFYHRVLKCHIIIELKVDKFRHEYASQLNMYLNYFKHEEMALDDNPPIGILFCTDKGEATVKYATGGMDKSIFVQKYLVELPTEEELKEYLIRHL